ncbi:hypothetical protein AX774_g8174 [Zancudomyces culisetae]|uniref:Uncharacterized protein n=1 Tax=Zancudomyces culisetae TaxID=1213189 RepID=A0A1R1PBW0_ZANCU|nr:hypothetical protein AX774_g8174 [Zancudomyces culisetae]|eukprot:OMH78440.1 hypothetical protein AX774_g8174 [Zancudomyces culisetae]
MPLLGPPSSRVSCILVLASHIGLVAVTVTTPDVIADIKWIRALSFRFPAPSPRYSPFTPSVVTICFNILNVEDLNTTDVADAAGAADTAVAATTPLAPGAATCILNVDDYLCRILFLMALSILLCLIYFA